MCIAAHLVEGGVVVQVLFEAAQSDYSYAWFALVSALCILGWVLSLLSLRTIA